jgi:hypothetical protein
MIRPVSLPPAAAIGALDDRMPAIVRPSMGSTEGGQLLAAVRFFGIFPPKTSRTAARLSKARERQPRCPRGFGPVLKVCEDGIITFFDGERVWDI